MGCFKNLDKHNNQMYQNFYIRYIQVYLNITPWVNIFHKFAINVFYHKKFVQIPFSPVNLLIYILRCPRCRHPESDQYPSICPSNVTRKEHIFSTLLNCPNLTNSYIIYPNPLRRGCAVTCFG